NPSNLVAADQKVPLESGKERHPRSIVNRCSSLSERNRACMEGLLPPSLAPDNHGTQSRHFQTSTSAITSFLTPLSITPRQNATIRAKKKEGGPAQQPAYARPPSAARAYAPVTTALPAGSISYAPHPTKPPAAGIYLPGRRHKCARSHARGGSAG